MITENTLVTKEPLYDVFQVAKMLSKTPASIRRYYRIGKIKGSNFGSDSNGGRILFRESDVKAFLSKFNLSAETDANHNG